MPSKALSPLAVRSLVLAAIVVLVFGRAIFLEFTGWDDNVTITGSALVNKPSFESVQAAWTTAPEGLYVPVTRTLWIGLASMARVQDENGNLTLNPWFFHGVNVLLHAGAAALAFLFIRRFVRSGGASQPHLALHRGSRGRGQGEGRLRATPADGPHPSPPPAYRERELGFLNGDGAALLGAAVFALHPIQVEAVAWASGTKDVLAWMLGIGALLLYVRHADESDRRTSRMYFALATLLLIAACLSKPTAAMIVLAAVAVDLMLLRRPVRRVARSIWPWVVLGAACSVVARIVQEVGNLAPPPPLWQRPFVAGDALMFYLWKLVWPFSMGIDYARPPQYVLGLPTIWFHWLAPAAVLTLVWIVDRVLPSTQMLFLEGGSPLPPRNAESRNRAEAAPSKGVTGVTPSSSRGAKRPYTLLAGAALFVIGVLPVLGLSPFQMQYYSTVADHYVYFSMLGVALIVAEVASRFRLPGPRWTGTALAGVLLVGLSIRSIGQAGTWQDSVSLFSQATQVAPRSFVGWNNLAMAYAQRHRTDLNLQFRNKSLEIKPDYIQAYLGRAGARLQLNPNDDTDADADIAKAIELTNALPMTGPQERAANDSKIAVIYDLAGRAGKARKYALMARDEMLRAQSQR